IALAAPTADPRSTAPAVRPARFRVLCVDDEPQVLEGLALQLRRRFEVLKATSGATALAMLQTSGEVAVIISDMRMPGMNGAAFLREACRIAPRASRILLTGQADLESAAAAVNEGQIFRFLSKPCPADYLLSTVMSGLDRHRLALAESLLADSEVLASTAVDSVLQNVASMARRLFPCRYIALGIHAREPWPPTEVLAQGFDPEPIRSSLSDAPSTLLAQLLRGNGAIRLQAPSSGSPLEGLPTGHPAVTHFLGVPLAGASKCHGWLTFADLADAPAFTAGDEGVAMALARCAAAIYEKATLDALANSQADELEQLARFDPLTGLANRVLFGERLGEWIGVGSAASPRLAVVELDLEHFSAINEAVGKAGGDEVLRCVARRLALAAGDVTRIARPAADRFVLAIPHEDSPESLFESLHERIWRPLAEPMDVGGLELRLTAKGGVALFPLDAMDPESLLQNAGTALKVAKRTSESCVRFRPEMKLAASQRLGMEARLRRALEHREFRLHYQPKVDLRSGDIRGAEALIRWAHPEQGLVPPAQFIPQLEDCGLIVDVGAWVLEQAAADHQHWTDAGLVVPAIAVNVSVLQLQRPDFVETVCRAMRSSATGQAIALEITESALMSDVEEGVAKLRLLRKAGVAIALDDFGTGYASLGYLAKLPVTTIKIDRSFVIRITESREAVAIVSAIISLAHALQLRVVAEGVDSWAQLERLRELGCDEMQGFLFSRPLAAAAFARLLREGRSLWAS
ncbi:MAG: GGDEF/EAL domain-containing response regulator, partial [Panacagrimonas sp.]